MHNKTESEMATKIQAAIRGFVSRKKYAINQLPTEKLENYRVLIIGNDPDDLKLTSHEAHESLALIGTSGMRSVEIAYLLGKGSTKLIILDNSKQVTDFWRKARSIISVTNSADDFLVQLKTYVQSSQCNRAELTEKEFGIEAGYKQCDFDAVKKIISNATIIGQSWSDKRTLTTIKNVLDYLKVTNTYTYTSNIVGHVNSDNKQEAQQILQNIEDLNPKIAIHSDYHNGHPKNFFLITDHSPSEVYKKLMGQNQTHNSTPLLEDEDYDQILTRSFRKKTNEVKVFSSSLKVGFFNKEDEFGKKSQLNLEKGGLNVF